MPWLILLITALAASAEPDRPAPFYASVRAEGVDQGALRADLRLGAQYVLKYVLKSAAAPATQIRHFQAQRALQKKLAAEALPGPAYKLSFVGDLMWIEDSWNNFLPAPTRAFLAEKDFLFGNLESPIAASQPVPTGLLDVGLYNAEPGLVRSFRGRDGRSLFSALSLANNHAFDAGDAGLAETIAFLQAESIPYSGVNAPKPYAVVEKPGLRIGFYATSWGYNDIHHRSERFTLHTIPGLAPDSSPSYDLSAVKSALEAMSAEGVDLKVVSLHWGHEYELYPSARQMQIARAIVALGADVIMGSGPHVVQPFEICFVDGYQGGNGQGCELRTAAGKARKALVIYSLGNFTTNMATSLCQIGMVANLRVQRGGREWQLEQPTFVYNHVPRLFQAAEVNERSLLLAADYQGELPELEFYKQHIWENTEGEAPEPPALPLWRALYYFARISWALI